MEQPMDHMTGQPSETGAGKGLRRDRKAPRSASWLAWALWLLVIVVEVLVIAFLLANDAQSTYAWIVGFATWIPFLAFSTVGAVILARRPGNRVGWLCWAIGFTITLSFWGSRQVWAVLAANQGRSSAWVLLTMLGTMAWLGTLLGLVPFLVLLFPTGRLLSPRWRPVAWAIGLVLGLYLTARLLTPGPLDPGLAGNPQNPLGVESAEGFLRLIQTLAGVAVPVLALAALASLVVRFRRARGEERQQLKWFTFVVAADLVLIPGVGELAQRVAPVLGALVVFPVTVSLIPIAIGVAVLKYRLYEIDRVINRTLVYGLLSALLGAVYAGLVLVLGQVFGGVGTEPPSWAVAGATLAVAALFQPARRRIQALVDRRFNRRKYNTAKIIEAYSVRLRDQFDLDTLSTELLAVVNQTVEPTRVWLWLRPSTPGSSGTPRSEERPTTWAY
jgi:hypothetical protein